MRFIFLATIIKHAADKGSTSGQSEVQQGVQNTQLGPESRRVLSTANYTANTNTPVEIPKDTVIKRINLQFLLACTTTFASGAPLLSPLGAIGRILPNFYLVADGSRNIKVLDLFMQRCLQAIGYAGFPRRAYRVGASLTSTTRTPTTEHLAGSPAYGVTTNDLVINESLDIMFENYFAYEQGRDISLLYTKNLSTCFMYFGWGAIDSIIETGNSAPVVYTNVDVSIVPTIVENRDADMSKGSFDFTETVIRKQYSSQQSQAQIDLNTGNKLVGLGILVQDGNTARSVSDTAVRRLNLVVNGSTSIQQIDFKQLMNDNKGRNGIGDDQYASGVHALQGFAYMNLLKNGSILSGLDTRLMAGVSQVQLLVDTAASTGVDPATYTNPVQVSVLQQQMIPVPVKS